MATQFDPEGVETRHLHEVAHFTNTHVLEIGCGVGRLTWRYAAAAARIVAVDPDPARLTTARRDAP